MVLVAVVVVGGAAAVLDVAEVRHQIDAARTLLVALAVVVLLAHGTAVVGAARMWATARPGLSEAGR